MTKTELLLRSVLGPYRRDIRPFVYAAECIIRQSFSVNAPIESILVTKDIYPKVALTLQIQPESAAQQIERIANDCWDLGDRDRLYVILGKEPPLCPPPREMLIYFAAFSYYGIPFQQAMDQQLATMF